MNTLVAVRWDEAGVSPVAALRADLPDDGEEANEEATAPLSREVSELEAMSIFPGVPLS